VRGDIVSIPRSMRLLEGERRISKLTLRPIASDVGEVKMFGDRWAWLIVSGGNRVFPAEDCWGGSPGWPLRSPPAKPRLQDPVLGAPPFRGEDPDRGLRDTELEVSSCSWEKSEIGSAGCERYGFG